MFWLDEDGIQSDDEGGLGHHRCFHDGLLDDWERMKKVAELREEDTRTDACLQIGDEENGLRLPHTVCGKFTII